VYFHYHVYRENGTTEEIDAFIQLYTPKTHHNKAIQKPVDEVRIRVITRGNREKKNTRTRKNITISTGGKKFTSASWFWGCKKEKQFLLDLRLSSKTEIKSASSIL